LSYKNDREFGKEKILQKGYELMKDRNRHPLQAMALVSIILSQLAGSVLIGLFSGRWADQWLDTEPLFLILGLLSGLAAGVFMMLRTVHHFFSGD
jgi:F0F1-type ATP synthase assembly protein I